MITNNFFYKSNCIKKWKLYTRDMSQEVQKVVILIYLIKYNKKKKSKN
jgi:hypothetical protein